MSRETTPERLPTSKEIIDKGAEVAPVSRFVVGIYTSPAKGEPTHKRESVIAEEGVGLEGDRYRVGVQKGTYSGHRILEVQRNVTIISQQGIEDARRELVAQGGIPFEDSETRRNIVVSGVSPAQLNALVEGNQSIWIGNVEVRVMQTAPPCNVPSQQYGKPGFRNVFERRGGVRGTIVNTGRIHQGDGVNFQKPQ
jgi:MOSC domain-containing protein YiiM